jgi:hypothetical protein
MDAQIIDTCKAYINEKNAYGLQKYYEDLMNTEFPRPPDWPYIFRAVYLHACLKGLRQVAQWLETELFLQMDPIEKIALRQIFPYGKHLLANTKAAKY